MSKDMFYMIPPDEQAIHSGTIFYPFTKCLPTVREEMVLGNNPEPKAPLQLPIDRMLHSC